MRYRIVAAWVIVVIAVGLTPALANDYPVIVVSPGQTVTRHSSIVAYNPAASEIPPSPAACSGIQASACDTFAVTLDIAKSALATSVVDVTVTWDEGLDEAGLAAVNELQLWVYEDPEVDSTFDGDSFEEPASVIVNGPTSTHLELVVANEGPGPNVAYSVAVQLTTPATSPFAGQPGPGFDLSAPGPSSPASPGSTAGPPASAPPGPLAAAAPPGAPLSSSPANTPAASPAASPVPPASSSPVTVPTFATAPLASYPALDSINPSTGDRDLALGAARSLPTVHTAQPRAGVGGATGNLLWFGWVPLVAIVAAGLWWRQRLARDA